MKLFYFPQIQCILISTYINTKKCVYVCVCLSVRVFLGHLESDWDILWHKVGFRHRRGFNTKIYLIGALINLIISVNWFKWNKEGKTMKQRRKTMKPAWRYCWLDLSRVSTRRSRPPRGAIHCRVVTSFTCNYYKKTDCIFGISMVELVNITSRFSN